MSAHKIQALGNHQKKEYNIQNMVKVWNQELFTGCLHCTHNESNRYIPLSLSEINEESDESQNCNILQQLHKTGKK